MSLSEVCSCGASFTAERDDELKLLNSWRTTHKCGIPKGGDLAMVDTANTSIMDDPRTPELHIGFRPSEADEDE
jgi:hypothetical protein